MKRGKYRLTPKQKKTTIRNNFRAMIFNKIMGEVDEELLNTSSL
jgi:hypothetical protein